MNHAKKNRIFTHSISSVQFNIRKRQNKKSHISTLHPILFQLSHFYHNFITSKHPVKTLNSPFFSQTYFLQTLVLTFTHLSSSPRFTFSTTRLRFSNDWCKEKEHKVDDDCDTLVGGFFNINEGQIAIRRDNI